MYWFLGLATGLIGGHFLVGEFLRRLRDYTKLGEKPPLEGGAKRVPPALTGAIERLFFTLLIALNISGTPAAMMAWLALKLATNWNHPDYKDNSGARPFAFSALLAGLVSMLTAVIAGTICRL